MSACASTNRAAIRASVLKGIVSLQTIVLAKVQYDIKMRSVQSVCSESFGNVKHNMLGINVIPK